MKKVLNKLNRQTDRSRVADAAPASPPPVASPPDDAAYKPFSPLDLDDRVVIKLMHEELIGMEEVEAAWYAWQKEGRRDERVPLWRVLKDRVELDDEDIFRHAAEAYAFQPVEFTKAQMVAFLRDDPDRFEPALWERMAEMKVVPVGRTGPEGQGALVLVTHDPTRAALQRFMDDVPVKRFELRYAAQATVESLIVEAFPRIDAIQAHLEKSNLAYDLGAEFEGRDELLDEDALEAEVNRSALIGLFETVLREAVRQGASDIHVVPNADRQIEIALRVDGALRRWHVEERIHPEAFLAVVKDQAVGVDRFVREKAQDGFIQRTIDQAVIRYRVSVLPVVNARLDVRSESVVIRVLDDRKVIRDLAQLGLQRKALDAFRWALDQPYGMVVLTGPTGSGKSTTLFAALNQVVSPERNVLTVEDPVEYVIPGVRQIKLSHQLVLDEALRAILRHDPDVVMVGEMRDQASAELAVKLANTGHLTFSTLHTNDAPSAVARLFKMGVEPFLIAYAINLVVAQRLVRVLCPACKEADAPDAALLDRLGFTDAERDGAAFHRQGRDPECPICHGVGYKKRRAITEVLPFDEDVRRLIVEAGDSIDEGALRRQAAKDGMLTLQDSARALVAAGETSLQEMMRVVYTSL